MGEVAVETRRNLTVLKPGSGYVCASIQNMQTNVPTDNVLALFDTALNHPIKYPEPIADLPVP